MTAALAPAAPEALSTSDALPVLALPRINLLPPEIGLRQTLRKVQAGLGAGVVAALGVVLALQLAATGSVSEAQAGVAASEAEHSALIAQAGQFREVTEVHTRKDAAQAMLVDAMSEEVRYSRFLDQFAVSLPDRVWVTSLTFNQGVPATPDAAAAGAIGSVQISGTAYSHDDVAAWLDALAAQEGFDGAYLQSSTERRLGGRVVVDFSTTVSLTAEALSQRYATTGD